MRRVALRAVANRRLPFGITRHGQTVQVFDEMLMLRVRELGGFGFDFFNRHAATMRSRTVKTTPF